MNHYAFSPILRFDASFLPLTRFVRVALTQAAVESLRNKRLFGMLLRQFCYHLTAMDDRSGDLAVESSLRRSRFGSKHFIATSMQSYHSRHFTKESLNRPTPGQCFIDAWQRPGVGYARRKSRTLAAGRFVRTIPTELAGAGEDVKPRVERIAGIMRKSVNYMKYMIFPS